MDGATAGPPADPGPPLESPPPDGASVTADTGNHDDPLPAALISSPPAANRRTEHRFGVNIKGTARSLMGKQGRGDQVHPITIIDISRRGMRFRVESGAPLYPLAEVSFTGPSGRIRCVKVKLLRMRVIPDEDRANRQVYEVAAQAVDEQESGRIESRQRRVLEIERALRRCEDTPVVVVGQERLSERIQTALKGAGHPVAVSQVIASLEATLKPTEPQAVVYLDGPQVLQHRAMLAGLREGRPLLAHVAVVQQVQDRRDLLGAGVDECVHAVNAHALVDMYVHRAIKACYLRAPAGTSGPAASGPARVLMLVANGLDLAQVGMTSHRQGLQAAFSYDVEGMLSLLRFTEVDALVLDGASAAHEDWTLLRQLRWEFPMLPIVVAVTDLPLGPLALHHGATEYLPLPATRQDLLTVVTSSQRVMEHEAAALQSGLSASA